MRDEHAINQTGTRSSLKYFLLMPILIVFGCSSAPDILPVGAPDLAKRDWVRRVVAYSDFPVLVTKSPGDQQEQNNLQISVTWRGKWHWFKTVPFATARKATFVLYEPGGGPLCTVEIPNTGKETDSPNCTFTNGKVIEYASRPLVGELSYWFGDNQDPEAEPVTRTYYVISQPTPVDPPTAANPPAATGQTR